MGGESTTREIKDERRTKGIANPDPEKEVIAKKD